MIDQSKALCLVTLSRPLRKIGAAAGSGLDGRRARKRLEESPGTKGQDAG